MRSFCFARIRLNPLSGKILYHDCVSVLVSRFTFFTENSVICCYQVTKLFCSRHWIASASSARCPCNFDPLADFALSVHRDVCGNTVLRQITHRASPCNRSPCNPQRSLLLRVFTGHVVESFPTESCDADEEDVLVDELEGLVDKPGTMIGTKVTVLHRILLPFLIRCGFCPLVHSVDYP